MTLHGVVSPVFAKQDGVLGERRIQPGFAGGLMRSERKHGLSTEQFPVSAYVGSSKNLKDLKVEPENGPVRVWGQVPCRHSRSDYTQSRPLVVLWGSNGILCSRELEAGRV